MNPQLRGRKAAAFFGFAALPAFLLVGAANAAALHPAPKTAETPIRANSDFRADLDMAREKVYPALVNIAVVAQEFQNGRAERAPAGGSGVVISPDGYVLTNFHVAGHTTRITCTSSTGESFAAHVVGHDPLADLSVLKLEIPKGHAPVPYAVLGDSDKMQVGDFVLAMGNPLMLSSSMTLGIVSNTHRVFTNFTGTAIEQQTLDTGERTGDFTRWIQHDALILPGNSGGPLVNLKGEVIGINELGGSGVGFAIPSDIAKYVFAQIVKNGSVRRGWLGVSILPVQKLGRSSGALVSSVSPDSPADKAGIKPGDIITSIDGHPINVQFFEQVPLFYQGIAAIPAGHQMQVGVLDQGKATTKTATIRWMDPFLGDEQDFPSAGITVRAITPAMAQERYLPNQDGVLITGVRNGYPFDGGQPDIYAGDIVTSVADHPITTMESFRKALADATTASGPGDKTVIAIRRGDQQILTTVVLVPQVADNTGGELPQAWLGITTQVVTPDIAAAVGQPGLTGFRITEVYPYTKANSAGLKAGDVITSLNGTALTASRQQDEGDLRQAIQGLTIGDTAKLVVNRNGQSMNINVPMEASPNSAAQAKTMTQKELEFSVREINDIDRFQNHWVPSQTGVLVTNATEGGYANIAGLQTDDLIVSVDGAAISKVADLTAALNAAAKAHRGSIEIFVRRDASTEFIFIEPDWSKITKLTSQ